MSTGWLNIFNGEAVALDRLPVRDVAALRADLQARPDARLLTLHAVPWNTGHRLVAVLADDDQGLLEAALFEAEREYESLTPVCPQAHLFEREIFEHCGLRPLNHPWLKPVRLPAPSVPFYAMHGEELHEVSVGPVHAGVIEPGHFRFQCQGEIVHHLEIALGYQHRGIERQLAGGPDARTVHLLETAAGDTSIGHAIAGVRIVETLTRRRVPARAQALRAVALELERLANHTGDLGALAGDVGFLPTQSYCGRLRGDFLNLTAMLCGNRFGRRLIRAGGVEFDFDDTRRDEFLRRLEAAARDVADATQLLWEAPSVLARFEDTGRVTAEDARAIGLVGPAARACGIETDVRCCFPVGLYQFVQIPLSTWHTGDVFARAYVRWLEIERSLRFVREQVENLPPGPLRAETPAEAPAPDTLVVALTEGWRGAIIHTALTAARGGFRHYKIVDPSFHNWFGLALAMRGQPVSDFPICNKSFNLSYCGFDL